MKDIKMKRIVYVMALTVVFASLSACSGVKKTLGLENSAPNEFLVSTRAPLTLPPEYDLRPVADSENLSPAITGQAAEFSKGEQALLSKLR